MMKFSTYIRFAVWEFLLVALASTALAYTLLDGFYIAPQLQYSPIPAAIALAVLVALYAISFNRRTLRVGAVVLTVCLITVLGASIALSPAEPMQDAEDNYFYFTLVCVVVPVLVFLLARRRGGTAILFIGGTFACALIQFFYMRYELLWTFVFLASALALIVYKNYQLSARTATSVGKLSFAAGFGVSLATVLVAVGLGSAVWFGIIAPLDPGAVQIKLITEIRALETVPVQGSSDEFLTPRMDLTSDKTNNDERTTDDLKQSEDGRPEPARPKDETTKEDEQSGSLMGVDLDSIVESFDFESNAPQAWLILGVLMLIPLSIAAYFIGRRLYRNHRLKKMQKLEPVEQVQALYGFLMSKLAKVGFALPAGSTVLEFARNNVGTMERMDAETGVDFWAITDVYADVTYGKRQPTSDQLQLFHQYYKGFWKAARKQLGAMRYFFKSFGL